MSTRCQIGIYKKRLESWAGVDNCETLLYKHSDGYPEGVLPILEPMLKAFEIRRGLSDTGYLGAWVLYALMDEHVQSMKDWAKERRDKEGAVSDDHIPEDGRNCLGFEICNRHGIHGDIEYFYAVSPSGLDVYKRVTEAHDVRKWRVIQTLSITADKGGK